MKGFRYQGTGSRWRDVFLNLTKAWRELGSALTAKSFIWIISVSCRVRDEYQSKCCVTTSWVIKYYRALVMLRPEETFFQEELCNERNLTIVNSKVRKGPTWWIWVGSINHFKNKNMWEKSILEKGSRGSQGKQLFCLAFGCGSLCLHAAFKVSGGWLSVCMTVSQRFI